MEEKIHKTYPSKFAQKLVFDKKSNEYVFIPYELKPIWPFSHVGRGTTCSMHLPHFFIYCSHDLQFLTTQNDFIHS